MAVLDTKILLCIKFVRLVHHLVNLVQARVFVPNAQVILHFQYKEYADLVLLAA